MLELSVVLFFGGTLGFIVALFAWGEEGVSPKTGHVSIWVSTISMGLGVVAYGLFLLLE